MTAGVRDARFGLWAGGGCLASRCRPHPRCSEVESGESSCALVYAQLRAQSSPFGVNEPTSAPPSAREG